MSAFKNLTSSQGRNCFRYLFTIGLVTALSVSTILPAGLVGPGDIAFVGHDYNGVTNNDDIAFVNLVAIDPGEVIFFDDSEWNGGLIGGGGAFDSGEGVVSWTNNTGNPIAPGTVITIINLQDDSPAISASTGLADEILSGFSLSSFGDNIYAYLGASRSPTAFLSALDNGTSHSLANTGLTNGVNAIDVSSVPSGPNSQYVSDRSTQLSFASYRSLINTPANWSTPVAPFNTTAFTIQAIPEPSSAVLLALVFTAGCYHRRRRMLQSL